MLPPLNLTKKENVMELESASKLSQVMESCDELSSRVETAKELTSQLYARLSSVLLPEQPVSKAVDPKEEELKATLPIQIDRIQLEVVSIVEILRDMLDRLVL